MLFGKRGDTEGINQVVKIIIVTIVIIVVVGGILFLFKEKALKLLDAIKNILRFGG